MPTNKHASFRYRVLDECFRRNRRWTVEELMEVVSAQLSEAFKTGMKVGKRTIESDIQLMRSEPPRGFLAPIIRKNHRYYYADRTYSIHKKPLLEQDIAAIREAVAVLRQFNGLPQFRGLADILVKMEGRANFPHTPVIQFETNEQAAGTEWLEQLYRAILDRTALDVRYHPFRTEEPLELGYHPYYLREYRNRWFVFGRHDAEGAIYTLALDRIRSLRPSPLPFRDNDIFDPETFFRDLIGVTRMAGAEPLDVVFRVTPLLSKYLATKPLHHSQRQLDATPEFVDFSIRVIPNYELYSELMRFGKALRVLGPETVLEALREF